MNKLVTITDPIYMDGHVTHITQSWEWGEFRSKTPTVKKVLRLQSSKRVFQIFFHRVPYLSSYSIAYTPRSPFPNQEELEEIIKICQREKAIFLKLEPFVSTQGKPINQLTNSLINYPHGDSILPQHTIYIDLTKSEEELLAGMHEKTRYNIRLAQKKGVIVREENTQEGLEKFIKLLESTEKRQGFYSHTADYYRLLWKFLSLHNMVHILNAYSPSTDYRLQTTAIASIMLFHFKDFIYYPYGGSDPNYREFMAPQLLHWEAMKLGKKLGAKTYDLWGSYKYTKKESDPFYGIYRLKSGFGGQEIDFPDTIDIPLSPLYSLFILINSLRWKVLQLKRSH